MLLINKHINFVMHVIHFINIKMKTTGETIMFKDIGY